MTDKKIDFSIAMPYLIKLNKNNVWQTLENENRAKGIQRNEYIVNFTIMEMFILRHKA